MKKIITLLYLNKLWSGIFKWLSIYVIFTVVATISNMQERTSMIEAFSKSLLWPVQFIKYLLAS